LPDTDEIEDMGHLSMDLRVAGHTRCGCPRLCITHGLLARMVAETAPTALRGTAFAFFILVSVVAILATSIRPGCGEITSAGRQSLTFP